MSKMCVYAIEKAPYVAVSNVYKERRGKQCLIKDTKGRIKKVDPLYVGPFDATKFLMFGALVSNFFNKDNAIPEAEVYKRSCELFGIAPRLSMFAS